MTYVFDRIDRAILHSLISAFQHNAKYLSVHQIQSKCMKVHMNVHMNKLNTDKIMESYTVTCSALYVNCKLLSAPQFN